MASSTQARSPATPFPKPDADDPDLPSEVAAGPRPFGFAVISDTHVWLTEHKNNERSAAVGKMLAEHDPSIELV